MAASHYNESTMQYGDAEYQIAKREIRDKTLWSYFWAATAGITAVASAVLGFGFGPEILSTGSEAIGTALTALGGVGAGLQSYSYDRESAALHDKLEIELAKNPQQQETTLARAINELSHELHEMQNEHLARSDGKSWAQFITDQRHAPEPQMSVPEKTA